MITNKDMRLLLLVAGMTLTPMAMGNDQHAHDIASVMPDLSGMAWVGGGRFLAVHDAKNPDELSRPRVGLVTLPVDLDGVLWKPLEVNWRGEPSSDLESAARIPGTDDYLLVESGDSGKGPYRRIFHGRLSGDSLSIEKVAPWPAEVYNIEGSAVARVGSGLVFIFAERAQDKPVTHIKWGALDPDTLTLGAISSVEFPNPDPKAYNRPLVGIDVDMKGNIYVVSAFDAEAAGLPDPDNGPFGSAVWRIGRMERNGGGTPELRLDASPTRLARLDGFKVESVAVTSDRSGTIQVFVGTDDENYGATIRLLGGEVAKKQTSSNGGS